MQSSPSISRHAVQSGAPRFSANVGKGGGRELVPGGRRKGRNRGLSWFWEGKKSRGEKNRSPRAKIGI